MYTHIYTLIHILYTHLNTHPHSGQMGSRPECVCVLCPRATVQLESWELKASKASRVSLVCQGWLENPEGF